MKRGVGYCKNRSCEENAKGVFLMNHRGSFSCPQCQRVGHIETERGFCKGDSDVFKEIRVEYNFDPVTAFYREIAIIRDESLWGRNNVYTLQSPLIKTEKRALKVAEAILANLKQHPKTMQQDEIPKVNEIILSLDDPLSRFRQKLRQLSQEWETGITSG